MGTSTDTHSLAVHHHFLNQHPGWQVRNPSPKESKLRFFPFLKVKAIPESLRMASAERPLSPSTWSMLGNARQSRRGETLGSPTKCPAGCSGEPGQGVIPRDFVSLGAVTNCLLNTCYVLGFELNSVPALPSNPPDRGLNRPGATAVLISQMRMWWHTEGGYKIT